VLEEAYGEYQIVDHLRAKVQIYRGNAGAQGATRDPSQMVSPEYSQFAKLGGISNWGVI